MAVDRGIIKDWYDGLEKSQIDNINIHDLDYTKKVNKIKAQYTFYHTVKPGDTVTVISNGEKAVVGDMFYNLECTLFFETPFKIEKKHLDLITYPDNTILHKFKEGDIVYFKEDSEQFQIYKKNRWQVLQVFGNYLLLESVNKDCRYYYYSTNAAWMKKKIYMI